MAEVEAGHRLKAHACSSPHPCADSGHLQQSKSEVIAWSCKTSTRNADSMAREFAGALSHGRAYKLTRATQGLVTTGHGCLLYLLRCGALQQHWICCSEPTLIRKPSPETLKTPGRSAARSSTSHWSILTQTDVGSCSPAELPDISSRSFVSSRGWRGPLLSRAAALCAS